MTLGPLLGRGPPAPAAPSPLDRGSSDWSSSSSSDGWMPPAAMGKGKGKGKISPTAISALTLLAFMFFLNVLQNCLKESVGQKTMVMMMPTEMTTPVPPAAFFNGNRFRRDAGPKGETAEDVVEAPEQGLEPEEEQEQEQELDAEAEGAGDGEGEAEDWNELRPLPVA